MLVTRLTQFYMLAVATVSMVALVYVYAFPPASMVTTREGVPYFTPKVAHPETGEALSVDELITHYRGD